MPCPVNSRFSARVKALTCATWSSYCGELERIELDAYEPARRDRIDYLFELVKYPQSVCSVCVYGSSVLGFSIAAPLERFAHIGGVTEDPQFGRGTTLYSADIAVAASFRGFQIGTLLKTRQVEDAKRNRFQFISCRNRVGLADVMLGINLRFGAKVVCVIHNAYNDDLLPRDAVYLQLNTDAAKDQLNTEIMKDCSLEIVDAR
jgi:hypothetical protein